MYGCTAGVRVGQGYRQSFVVLHCRSRHFPEQAVRHVWEWRHAYCRYTSTDQTCISTAKALRALANGQPESNRTGLHWSTCPAARQCTGLKIAAVGGHDEVVPEA